MKVDIINAQRGFSDPNSSDSNEAQKMTGNLSVQFREYYSMHLNPSDLPDPSDIEAIQAIEDDQSIFDTKLGKSFQSSLSELEDLGYPGIGNPKITLSSKVRPIDSLNHSTAVQFNVLDSDSEESGACLKLPEKYNGLGYQNLISMIFKLIRFRDEWMLTGKKGKNDFTSKEEKFIEPIHLVLIEEPEAHLRNHNELKEKKHFSTQLVVSTHSSHIAHEVEFTNLRYFKRKNDRLSKEVPTATVVNLSDVFGGTDATTKFASRYLKTTHCDLFFADASIIVEGPAERMLIPHFINQDFKNLTTCYVSVLEIGGSHAHRLRPLIEKLGLVSLIITDIDSIDPSKERKAVKPEKGKAYCTNNSTLKEWIPGKESLDELLDLKSGLKEDETRQIRVSYQHPIKVKFNGAISEVAPYTFEDALVFENIDIFKCIDGNGLIKKFKAIINENTDLSIIQDNFFEELRTGEKAKFALDLLFLEEPKNIKIPAYIKEGLDWLEQKLVDKQNDCLTEKKTNVK
jgi:predicted ATP-dependent endonuclease of OLD family